MVNTQKEESCRTTFLYCIVEQRTVYNWLGCGRSYNHGMENKISRFKNTCVRYDFKNARKKGAKGHFIGILFMFIFIFIYL